MTRDDPEVTDEGSGKVDEKVTAVTADDKNKYRSEWTFGGIPRDGNAEPRELFRIGFGLDLEIEIV